MRPGNAVQGLGGGGPAVIQPDVRLKGRQLQEEEGQEQIAGRTKGELVGEEGRAGRFGHSKGVDGRVHANAAASAGRRGQLRRHVQVDLLYKVHSQERIPIITLVEE